MNTRTYTSVRLTLHDGDTSNTACRFINWPIPIAAQGCHDAQIGTPLRGKGAGGSLMTGMQPRFGDVMVTRKGTLQQVHTPLHVQRPPLFFTELYFRLGFKPGK